eukprot:PhF_6_TR32946/c2_g1_i2/m.48464/K01805/xylA; xylose isomerase
MSTTKEYFPGISKIQYEGPASTNPLAFKSYNPNEVVMGKPMKEWLRYAVCWWHTFNGGMGRDPFSSDKTHLRSWDKDESLETYKERVNAAFEFFSKLGVEYYTFHDIDVAPMGASIEEFERNLDAITDLMLAKQKETGIKLLWGTQNLFSAPMFKDGAATSPDFRVFARACAQTRKMLDITKKLGGENHVFWGGREGFMTQLNTDVRKELDHYAAFLSMVVEYKKKIGATYQLLIEPKPREPTTHQYDYDAQTVIGFLHQYGLTSHFKLNIEPNHTTLAGHDYEHDILMSSAYGMLGSVDCNAGDMLLGWDTDLFPTDLRKCMLSMMVILQQGGIAPGGNNFDSKLRRESSDVDDMFVAHIVGMDAMATGLRAAARALESGRLGLKSIAQRYATWESPLAKKVEEGKATLEELEAYAKGEGRDITLRSGKQELLEGVLNNVMMQN